MTHAEFRAVLPEEARRFYSTPTLPQMHSCTGLFVDGELLGLSGTLPYPAYVGSPLEEEAPCIGFLNLQPGLPLCLGLEVVRHMRNWLKAEKRTVFVQHDDSFPHSEQLLRILGFRPTHQSYADANSGRQLRVWARPAIQ